MTREDVIELYEKERNYQIEAFGDYKNNPSLNLSSFLIFLDDYLNKAMKYYLSKWSEEKPPWLLATRESIQQNTSPVDTYEQLIKIFALSGAALEAYAAIDVNKWREDGVKDKWKGDI